ncbi:MAG: serine/threonine protein kinase [Myxococcales bacterium]|nr:serine/threonine protein kinase [Myxococcales bacterium]
MAEAQGSSKLGEIEGAAGGPGGSTESSRATDDFDEGGDSTENSQRVLYASQPTSEPEIPAYIGRYKVVCRLGSGGMADVYLCRQSGMGGFDRQVVIKQIRQDLRDREDVIFMFLDEARIIAQVNHPNVVQIYDIDEQDGLPYLVMEWVRGLSLQSLMRRVEQRGQQFPVDLVAAIGAQVCAGLQAAHEMRDLGGAPLNVVHRDISPSNLLISVDGIVKIIDFGVARAKNRLSVTSAGRIKGRVGYIAPEALSDQPIDRRADLFALGVVMYELCSGKPLFEREGDATALASMLTQKVPPLSSVRPDAPPGMTQILSRVLEIDRKLRPATAAELGTALFSLAMQTGRFVSSHLVAEWLDPQLPRELRAHGRGLTPAPSRLAPESTQQQPSPFSTTQMATPPSSSVSPLSSQATNFQMAQPQLASAIAPMVGEVREQLKYMAPATSELALQVRALAPTVDELQQQVRRLRWLYWPILVLFWLMGLGLILLGVWMMLHVGSH